MAWPVLLVLAGGIGSARMATVASLYSGYYSADPSYIPSYSGMILLAMLVPLGIRKNPMPSGVHEIMGVCLMVLMPLFSFASAYFLTFGDEGFPSLVVMGALTGNTVLGPLCMAFWLRRLRGSSTLDACFAIYSAMLMSSAGFLLCAVLPDGVAYFVAASFGLLQLPMLYLWRHGHHDGLITAAPEDRPFSGMGTSSHSSLLYSALAVLLLCFTIGFLRSFPHGTTENLSPAAGAASQLMIIVLCLLVLGKAVKGKREELFSFFILVPLLACVASMLMLAASPDLREAGMAIALSANALMLSACFFLAVGFMDFGRRDPLFYLLGCWLLCTIPRGVSTGMLASVPGLSDNSTLALVVAGDLLLLIALVPMRRAFRPAPLAVEESEEQSSGVSSTLMRLLALSDGESLETTDSLRTATIEMDVAAIGEEFQLSKREMEVLALYIAGNTQKAIGERLFVSSGTVRNHIKHIYAKTGFHSRQEIIEHLKN